MQAPDTSTPVHDLVIRLEADKKGGPGAYATLNWAGPSWVPYDKLLRPSEIGALAGTLAVRGVAYATPDDLAQVGQQLFQALVGGELRRAWKESVADAQSSGKPPRLTMVLTDRSLAQQPWELLFDERSASGFLAVAGWSIIRAVEQMPPPGVPGPSTLPSDLTVTTLTRISNSSSPESSVPSVRSWLSGMLPDRLAYLADQHVVALDEPAFEEEVHRATLGPRLASAGTQILHCGRSSSPEPNVVPRLNESAGLGARSLELLHGLAEALAGVTSLRLVVLALPESDLFADALAAELGATGPGVVGLRGRAGPSVISDFTDGFYRALAQGNSAEAAVAAARTQLYLRQPGAADWAIPVCYHPPRFPFVRSASEALPSPQAYGSVMAAGDVRQRLLQRNLFELEAQKQRGATSPLFDEQISTIQQGEIV
jgi:hypothetical protein